MGFGGAGRAGLGVRQANGRGLVRDHRPQRGDRTRSDFRLRVRFEQLCEPPARFRAVIHWDRSVSRLDRTVFAQWFPVQELCWSWRSDIAVEMWRKMIIVRPKNLDLSSSAERPSHVWLGNPTGSCAASTCISAISAGPWVTASFRPSPSPSPWPRIRPPG